MLISLFFSLFFNCKVTEKPEFISLENIKVSPFSRAYTFSDSIYEVVPFYNSQPIEYDKHINRLQYSANALSIKINLDIISDEIKKLISSCKSKKLTILSIL